MRRSRSATPTLAWIDRVSAGSLVALVALTEQGVCVRCARRSRHAIVARLAAGEATVLELVDVVMVYAHEYGTRSSGLSALDPRTPALSLRASPDRRVLAKRDVDVGVVG